MRDIFVSIDIFWSQKDIEERKGIRNDVHTKFGKDNTNLSSTDWPACYSVSSLTKQVHIDWKFMYFMTFIFFPDVNPMSLSPMFHCVLQTVWNSSLGDGRETCPQKPWSWLWMRTLALLAPFPSNTSRRSYFSTPAS